MIIARIVASVVFNRKDAHYKGHKILVVQPLDAQGNPKASRVWRWTVRTAICAIVDRVGIEEQA